MIFVDTSFWVAVRNKRDPHHAAATQLLRAHSDGALVTTNHIRGETWTYLNRKGGHGSAVGFLDALDSSPRAQVVRVASKLEAAAIEWLRRHDERAYSFVDATSFAVMRSMRIREALAFGGDFAAAGFVELRPSG